jgi:hypothetical protein
MHVNAYGKVLSDAGGGKRQAPTASVTQGRVGQYVFWLLIIVIVSAQIIYYPGNTALGVESATYPKHALMS